MPEIRTERLLLRPFRNEDAPALAAHRSDPEVARYVHWSPPYPRSDAEALIARTPWTERALRAGEAALLALELLEAPGELIGDFAVGISHDDDRQASIGYTLARAAQGHGYATEAARAVLDRLFRGDVFSSQPLHRVIALCDSENRPSQRVLERLGFRREAHFIESAFLKDRWISDYQYALLRREWTKRPR